ncbi:YtxH domain-containing protein [Albibacterium indicum]|uniref:YtxH domain-containing protein n=1 Tax=Albibacterium indicum TaxID=2292082 RepID=UPI000E4C1EE6|nr:YtxH domain-containing protein [Pedobacter indicus]
MNDNAKVVAALLAGLAAGAAVGLLFAPEKGADTREKLNESLKDLGEAIKERSAEQKEHINELKDKLVSTIKGKVNRGVENLESEIDEHA